MDKTISARFLAQKELFDTQGYFVPPSGTTTERFVEVANNAVSASSARGINGGGYIAPSNTNTMQYITIATTGNAADFGDLSAIRNVPGAVASSTRGIWMGGVGPSQETQVWMLLIM